MAYDNVSGSFGLHLTQSQSNLHFHLARMLAMKLGTWTHTVQLCGFLTMILVGGANEHGTGAGTGAGNMTCGGGGGGIQIGAGATTDCEQEHGLLFSGMGKSGLENRLDLHPHGIAKA